MWGNLNNGRELANLFAADLAEASLVVNTGMEASSLLIQSSTIRTRARSCYFLRQ